MRAAAALILVLCSTPVLAHPSGVSGFVHPFTGLDHTLALLTVGIWAAQLGPRARWAVPVAFLAAMAAGGILGVAGMTVPALEPMLLATVLILGLMAALRVRQLAGGVAVATACALLHGLAHGGELPAGAEPAGYFAGFLLAGGVIQAAGMLLGLKLLSGRPLRPYPASRSRPEARRLPRP